MLLMASLVTYGILAFVTPVSYETVSMETLEAGLDELAVAFENVEYADIHEKISAFCNEYNVNVVIVDPVKSVGEVFIPNEVEFPDGSSYYVNFYNIESMAVTDNTVVQNFSVKESDGGKDDTEVRIADIVAETGGDDYKTSFVSSVFLSRELIFSDREGSYVLNVSPQRYSVNTISRAFIKTLPLLLLAVLLFSALCSFFYTGFITKLRKENAALERDIEQERRREAERFAFFSAVSHELKTPITILKGQLTGMLDGVDVYRDREKYLARALNITGRMEGMVRELLTVARLETFPENNNGATAELTQLVKKSLELHDELARQKNMTLHTDIAEDVFVTGDGQLISKALDNILSNAVFYSPDKAALTVVLTRQSDRALLRVTNSGVTIPDEALPHLFEPFFRVEKSRSRTTGGSGLGLYLVRLIFERLNAGYAIENTKDGICFTVRFFINSTN
jgi:two-component system sensor histidine kinase VanS